MRSITHKLQVVRNPSCTRCALHKSSVNVCVMGRGNHQAKVFLIGEAPGEAEAKTGKPFMGRAGKQILNPLLRELDVEDKVYITNVVKCRPPDNRKPTHKECLACQKYLEGERSILKPVAMVLMGRTAITGVLGKDANVRIGGDYWCSGTWMFPTYHPAYYLYNRTKPVSLRWAISEAIKVAYGNSR